MDAMSVTKFPSYIAANVAMPSFAHSALMPTIGATIFILSIVGVLLLVAVLDWQNWEVTKLSDRRKDGPLNGQPSGRCFNCESALGTRQVHLCVDCFTELSETK